MRTVKALQSDIFCDDTALLTVSGVGWGFVRLSEYQKQLAEQSLPYTQ